MDLTEAALEATRKHFAVMGLTGRFEPKNAERLGFADGSFDWGFSHGVLHHTPNTQADINEVFRVLTPGVRAIIMFYHKHSFNHWVRIMTYTRLRVLLKILSRVGRWNRDRRAVAGILQELRGNQNRRVWSIHYQNFLRDGWCNLRAGTFVHHCTGGPECPVAYAFSRAEAAALFSSLRMCTLGRASAAEEILQRHTFPRGRVPGASDRTVSVYLCGQVVLNHF